MASITLAGTLLDPNGDLAVGDQIRFTHNSTTGSTVKGAVSVVTINPAGTYTLPLQFGLVLVEYKDVRGSQFKNLGVATVNASNPATSIPELLNALVPVSSAELIEFQAILADAVAAKTAAEAALAAIPTYGTAATRDVTTSTTDTTTGRLIKQGDTGKFLAASTSGSLGIGIAAPHEKLVSLTSDNTTVGLCAYEETIGGSAKLHLDVRNNAGLPITMSAIRSAMTFGGTGAESGNLQFDTINAGTRAERMRITASGDVGIGISLPHEKFVSRTSDNTTAALCAFEDTVGGSAKLHLDVRNDIGSPVTMGAIRADMTFGGNGVESGDLQFDTINSGARALRMRITATGDVLPGANGTQDLGSTSLRFDTLFATNGTINTSDVNEKQDIELLDEAEIRVAQKCKTLLKKFRWRDMVEEKGEDARIHFGIIAQDLAKAFGDEGLDAGRYGMFTSSTWVIDEETGEERTRLGVRYTELLAFIISAI
jgi:hypothetical protein